MRCLVFVITAGLLSTAIPVLHAQSTTSTLADVAKKEQDRRAKVKDGKSYTNKDLKEGPPPSVVSSSDPVSTAPKDMGPKPADPAPAAGDSADGKAATKDGAKPATDAAGGKDQDYWRKRITSMRDQLERDKVLADALQSRINALTTDFVNRDDPAQRAVIQGDRNRALQELDRMRKQVEDDIVAIKGIEEEARAAGVPAGWLR